MIRRYFLLLAVLLLCIACGKAEQKPAPTETADAGLSEAAQAEVQKRIDLFDQCVEMTLKRTAWSPTKWQSVGSTFEEEIERLGMREEFAKADTEQAIKIAMLRFFNARRDSHVASSVDKSEWEYAPIRFLPDLSKLPSPDSPMRCLPVFVANFTPEAEEQGIKRGDGLISINGISVEEFYDQFRLLDPASTLQSGLVKSSGVGDNPSGLASKSDLLPTRFFPQGKDAEFVLTDVDSGETKTIKLQYSTKNQSVKNWSLPNILRGRGNTNRQVHKEFYKGLGYKLLVRTQDGNLWSKPRDRIAILEWFDFEEVEKSTRAIIKAARRNNVLNHDLIIDATHSSGGSEGWRLVRVLSDAEFTPTFGNVRVTDRQFVESHKETHNKKIEKWIQDALDANQEYTTNEPFKLKHDAVISPGPICFSGRKVLLMFPWGGSHVDQFAAMICDNVQVNKVLSMGTTMGGFSNTWEWNEMVTLPFKNNRVKIKWNVGHTIRPNGEILEGNPARALDWAPLTPKTADDYFGSLIRRAEKRITDFRKTSKRMGQLKDLRQR